MSSAIDSCDLPTAPSTVTETITASCPIEFCCHTKSTNASVHHALRPSQLPSQFGPRVAIRLPVGARHPPSCSRCSSRPQSADLAATVRRGPMRLRSRRCRSPSPSQLVNVPENRHHGAPPDRDAPRSRETSLHAPRWVEGTTNVVYLIDVQPGSSSATPTKGRG